MAPSLPPSLRRAAARSAGPRGREPSTRLLDAARAGVLSRSNTMPGTAGRRAVDRATYSRRVAGRLPGESAREALGHPRRRREGERGPSMTAVTAERGFVRIEDPSRGERRRIARYNALVAQLVQGRLDPKRFRRRVRGWRPIAGEHFEHDPDVVLAVLAERQATGREVFEYTGRRQ